MINILGYKFVTASGIKQLLSLLPKSHCITNLLLVTLVLTALPSIARRHSIPAPQLSQTNALLAPGDTLVIRGSGFINNYPEGHRVYLKDSRNKLHRLKVLYANASELHIEASPDLVFGDYLLGVKLQSKWLESAISVYPQSIRLRPAAPHIELPPKLVFQDLFELQTSLEEMNKPGLIYQFTEALKLGQNELSAYYYQDGFLSLASPSIEVMLLASANGRLEQDASGTWFRPFKLSELDLELPANIYDYSENPEQNKQLRRTLLSTSSEPIDVSDYVLEHQSDYSQDLYLQSPREPYYLLSKTYLSPIKFKDIHIKSPESVVLYNRSSKTLSLAGCSLSDTITTRHTLFEPSSLTASDIFTYTGDLGLNDTGGDALHLDCPCSHPLAQAIRQNASLEAFSAPLCNNSKMRLESYVYD